MGSNISRHRRCLRLAEAWHAIAARHRWEPLFARVFKREYKYSLRLCLRVAARGPSAGSFPRMPPRANEEKKWKRSGKFNTPVRRLADSLSARVCHVVRFRRHAMMCERCVKAALLAVAVLAHVLLTLLHCACS